MTLTENIIIILFILGLIVDKLPWFATKFVDAIKILKLASWKVVESEIKYEGIEEQ